MQRTPPGRAVVQAAVTRDQSPTTIKLNISCSPQKLVNHRLLSGGNLLCEVSSFAGTTDEVKSQPPRETEARTPTPAGGSWLRLHHSCPDEAPLPGTSPGLPPARRTVAHIQEARKANSLPSSHGSRSSIQNRLGSQGASARSYCTRMLTSPSGHALRLGQRGREAGGSVYVGAVLLHPHQSPLCTPFCSVK